MGREDNWVRFKISSLFNYNDLCFQYQGNCEAYLSCWIEMSKIGSLREWLCRF